MSRIKKFIIDLRPLQSYKYGGVQTVNRLFIDEIVKKLKSDQEIVFFSSGFKKPKIHLDKLESYLKKSNIRHKHLKVPNILLNLSLAFFNWPKIDKLAYKKLNFKSKRRNQQKISYLCLDIRPFALSKISQSFIYFHDLAFKYCKNSLSARARLYFWLIRPKNIYKKARLVLSNSDYSRRILVKNYGKKAIKIVYPSINKPEAIHPDYKIKNKTRQILCIQTLQKRKNLELIYKIAQVNLDHKFKIIGSGQNCFKSAKKLQLTNIEFLSNINDQEKFKLIQESKALLYTSKFEGFGLPIYEALVYKTPVICLKTQPYKQLFHKIGLNYIQELKDYKIPNDLIKPKNPYKYNLRLCGQQLYKMLVKNR